MLFRTLAITAALTVLTACGDGPPQPVEMIGELVVNRDSEPWQWEYAVESGRHCSAGECVVIDKAARTIRLESGSVVTVPADIDISGRTISMDDGNKIIDLVKDQRQRDWQSGAGQGSDEGGSGGGGGLD